MIEAWSGYFEPTDPSGREPISVGSPHANFKANLHAQVDDIADIYGDDRPTYFGFYVGDRDETFRDDNERLDRELGAAGVPHVFREYPGGHTGAFWDAHEEAWTTTAVRRLLRPA